MLSQLNTAIFVCDVQGCFVKTIHGFDEVVNATSFLLQGSRILDLPCIITEQYPERLQHTGILVFPHFESSRFFTTIYSRIGRSVKVSRVFQSRFFYVY